MNDGHGALRGSVSQMGHSSCCFIEVLFILFYKVIPVKGFIG